MIERAVIEHDLDISQSFMIGDKEADIIAGKKAGLTTILVGTGYGRETEKKFKGYDHYFDDISGIRSVI
jgi:phosphoglycolate phosphatase-like HAD superfamily hydrolase